MMEGFGRIWTSPLSPFWASEPFWQSKKRHHEAFCLGLASEDINNIIYPVTPGGDEDS